MIVRIVPLDHGAPAGKLADAELHFADGPLQGLKLAGFAVWQRRSGDGVNRGALNVTFPARNYSVNGQTRSFALLRPIGDQMPQERLRQLILAAYTEFEEAKSEAEG